MRGSLGREREGNGMAIRGSLGSGISKSIEKLGSRGSAGSEMEGNGIAIRGNFGSGMSRSIENDGMRGRDGSCSEGNGIAIRGSLKLQLTCPRKRRPPGWERAGTPS